MAILSTVPPGKATGELSELYLRVEGMFGIVPENVQLLGVSPPILENQLDFVDHYLGHSSLSMPLLAMIRMLVSNACKSPYCENLNAGLLMQGGISAEQIGAMKSDPRQAPLDDKEKELLLFVLKATGDPHSVTAEDVDKLRSLGWKDQDIFDAVAHGARSVATNLIFDTFKIGKD
jgi:alkylhydroperoxidase family enzyme